MKIILIVGVSIPMWLITAILIAVNWDKIEKLFKTRLLTKIKKEYNIPLSKIN